MASSSCVTSTVRSTSNEDPYLLESKVSVNLSPFSNKYGPRRLSLPPWIIPAQPTRRPPTVPVTAENRPRSHTNVSTPCFSPPPSAPKSSNANPCLLPPFLSSAPTTASSSPHNKRPLSYQQTPTEFKSRPQSTSSTRQYQRLPQPGHQTGLCRTTQRDVATPGFAREPGIFTDPRQDMPGHTQDLISRRNTRLPPRLSDNRKLGPSAATFEARQHVALVKLAGLCIEGSGSGISASDRNGSGYYHSRCLQGDQGLKGESIEVKIRTVDQQQPSGYMGDGVAESFDCLVELEEEEMMQKGLKNISVEEYREDINSLMWMVFAE